MSDYEDDFHFSNAGSSSVTTLTSDLNSNLSCPLAEDGNPNVSDSDHDLIMQLLKEDHDDLKSRQKGKEKAGEVTDFQLSLQIWNQEINSTIQCFRDANFALSMNDAVVSDAAIIASIQEQERLAARDHELALRMSGNTGNSPSRGQHVARTDAVAGPSRSDGDNDAELVSKVISDLEQLTISRPTNRSASAQASSSGTRRQGKSECVVCTQTLPTTPLHEPPCGDLYCDNCLRELFLQATNDEGLFPPRCCANILPANLAMRLLDYSELVAFCKAGAEFSTKDRLYCADPACSAFIPPWVVEGERGKCLKCHKVTHTVCKALGEPDHDCPSDEALQSVLALAEKTNWQRCPKCKTMVELGRGCHHITCRCGTEFCYLCQAAWKTCKCPVWHEYRLLDVAYDAAHNEMERQVDEAGRAEVLERVVQGLRNHEEVGCHHEIRSNWRFTRDHDVFKCEMCSAVLPDFIFECKGCLMMACKRCMRNRFR